MGAEKEQPSSIRSDIVSRRDNIPQDSDSNTSNWLPTVAEELVAHKFLVPAVGLQELDRGSKGKKSTAVIFPTDQDPTILHQGQAPTPIHRDRPHELDMAWKTP